MNLHSVDAYFIQPLVQYFEKEPKDGVLEHITSTLDGTDIRLLEGAVEWIKSNRQATSSFPSPKECFAAVQAVMRKKYVEQDRATEIVGLTYGQKLKAWLAAGGKSVLIRKNTFEWQAWEDYFVHIGNELQLDFLKEREEWTVPSLLPSDFDRSI